MTMAQLPAAVDYAASAHRSPEMKKPVVVLPPLRATHELGQHLAPPPPPQQPQQFMYRQPSTGAVSYLPTSAYAAPVQYQHERDSEQDEAAAAAIFSGPLRRGKWTRAEEDFAAALISYFCDGLLNIQYGTTLRGFLAQQLHCDPMRISKKLLPGSVFAGIKINPKIGRRAYYPCSQDSTGALAARDAAARHLAMLRRAFVRSVEEEEALETSSSHSTSPTRASSPAKTTAPPPAMGRKRSYDDIMRSSLPTVELTAPQITYHSRSPSKLPRLTTSTAQYPAGINAGRRRSFTATPSPPMTAVLPPLRVSLVRASLAT